MTMMHSQSAPALRCLLRYTPLLLLAIPGVVAAQEPQPGARVRVTHVRGQQVGTLRSVAGDSIRFTTSTGVDMALPAHDVALLETSVGSRRQFWKHLGIVSGGFVAAGSLLGAAAYEPCESTGFMSCFLAPTSQGEALLLGGVLGAVVGVPLGVLAGAAIKTERWAPVATVGHALSRVSIRMAPLHGVGVSGTYVLGSGFRR